MNFTKIKKDLSKVYNELAPYWGQDKTLHDWGRDDLLKFAKLVGRGAKVLDLGCASGYQSKLLCDQGLNVVGIDLSPKMIAVVQKRVLNAEFAVRDMTEMDFAGGSFDGVYARASLLHIPKKLIPKVLNSISKILKENGYLYLALKEGSGEGEFEDERHGRKFKRFFSFFEKQEIINLLSNAGFGVEGVTFHQRDTGTTKWIKVFSRKVSAGSCEVCGREN